MKRLERVGVFRETPEYFRATADAIAAERGSYGDFSNPSQDQDARRTFDLLGCVDALLLQHFEIDHHLGATRPYADKAAELAVDYFFGPWRDAYKFGRRTLKRRQCRKELEWVRYYRFGLLAALLIDDDQAVSRLAEWPDVDVNKTDLDDSPADLDYQIVLAYHLLGKPAAKGKKLVAGIEAGTKRRPKLLLSAFLALQGGDLEGFSAALIKYLQYYRRHEAELDQLDLSVSLDGSILRLVARRAGLPVPDLTEEWMDRLVTAESAGLA